MATALESFGRVFPPAPTSIKAAEAIKRLKAGEQPHPDSLLAYGNGRSYGDSCLNSNGALIDMRAMDRILGFDASTGILEAEAGTLLSDIIALCRAARLLPAGRARHAIRDACRGHRQ